MTQKTLLQLKKTSQALLDRCKKLSVQSSIALKDASKGLIFVASAGSFFGQFRRNRPMVLLAILISLISVFYLTRSIFSDFRNFTSATEISIEADQTEGVLSLDSQLEGILKLPFGQFGGALLDETDGRLNVVYVPSSSEAHSWGFEQGDAIVEHGSAPVSSIFELRSSLNEARLQGFDFTDLFVRRGSSKIAIGVPTSSFPKQHRIRHTLGITFKDNGNGLSIYESYEGSLARELGLRSNDRVTEVFARPVLTLENLNETILYARRQNYERVSLKVERPLETLVLDVSLEPGSTVGESVYFGGVEFKQTEGIVIVGSLEETDLNEATSLQAGDVILEMNSQSVFDLKQVEKQIETYRKNTQERMLVKVERHGVQLFSILAHSF